MDAVKVIPQEGAQQTSPLSAVVWSCAKIQQTRQVRLLNLEVIVETIQHLPAVNFRGHRGTDASVSVSSIWYPVSRRLTDFPRHVPRLRERDGGVSWEKLVVHLEVFHGRIVNRVSAQWIDHLMRGTDKQQTRVLLRSASSYQISTSSQHHSG